MRIARHVQCQLVRPIEGMARHRFHRREQKRESFLRIALGQTDSHVRIRRLHQDGGGFHPGGQCQIQHFGTLGIVAVQVRLKGSMHHDIAGTHAMTSTIAGFFVATRQYQSEVAVTMPVSRQHREAAPKLTTIEDWT